MGSERPTIVVGWDGSSRARDALALAGVLAAEQKARVRVVTAYPHHDLGHSPELIDESRRGAGTRLDEVPLELVAGAPAELALTPASSPAEGLQREAERCDASLIVVGSSARARVGHVLAGSVAERLLHGAPCAVAVAPAGYAESRERRLRVLAVAFDGSRESRAAADYAVRLCGRVGASLRVISVAEPPGTAFGLAASGGAFADVLVESREQWRVRLHDLVSAMPPSVRADARLRDGNPVGEIVAECTDGVDLLVVGSRGYGTIRRTLLGSVSAPLVRAAPCPVLVLPAVAGGPALGDADGRLQPLSSSRSSA